MVAYTDIMTEIYENAISKVSQDTNFIVNDFLISSQTSRTIQESAFSKVKEFIKSIIDKIISLFNKCINFFKEKSQKSDEDILKEFKEKILTRKYSGANITLLRTAHPDKFDITPVKNTFNKKIDDINLTIKSIHAGYIEGNESKNNDKDVVNKIINKDKDDLEKLHKSAKTLQDNVITADKCVIDLNGAKKIYSDFEKFSKSKNDFTKFLKESIDLLKSEKSAIDKLPTDLNPNSVSLLKQRINIIYSMSNTIVKDYTKVCNYIHKYYISIFSKFINYYYDLLV